MEGVLSVSKSKRKKEKDVRESGERKKRKESGEKATHEKQLLSIPLLECCQRAVVHGSGFDGWEDGEERGDERWAKSFEVGSEEG